MPSPYLIIDGHLDLAFSALQVNRDLTQPAATVRAHDPDPLVRSFGSCTVTFPELRKGNVGIVLGTVMSRLDPNDQWTRTGMYTQSQCYGVGRGHYAYYEAMEWEGVIRFIHDVEDLDEVLADWEEPRPDTPIGLVLAMESADPILGPDQVPEWYDLGLRMVSISHYGTSAYSHGTGTEGGLLPTAKPLLDALREAGIIVDLTHTTDISFWEILDLYDGPVCASHHNCRVLTPGQRQLTDDMIKAIAERDGVIGAACDAWMLDPEWKREVPCYEQITSATLETVADHVDHVVQLLGNARNAGIGSDLDGGFGTEQGPRDLNTIADLQKLASIFEERGYADEDIRSIMSGNWIRLLRQIMQK
ncbi:MAG: membrane dipeptidase [Candidatus Latescibacteria bacterium]|jgi:membrane dipeptidase|nr:membrane dipeptidase [Candidatus Latescibacterota bacterium]